jgi:hypothetical protein
MKVHQRNGHARRPAVTDGVNGNGRDAAGRFVPGNKGGTGNPFNRRLAELRSELVEAVGSGGMGRLARALLRNVEKGDLASAKLLLSYTIGRPLPGVHPDALDEDEHARVAAGASAAAALDLNTLPLGFAIACAHGMQAAAVKRLIETTGPLVGWGTWRKIVESAGDPELSAWYDEHERLAVAEQLHGARAGAKPAHAGGGGNR